MYIEILSKVVVFFTTFFKNSKKDYWGKYVCVFGFIYYSTEGVDCDTSPREKTLSHVTRRLIPQRRQQSLQ